MGSLVVVLLCGPCGVPGDLSPKRVWSSTACQPFPSGVTASCRTAGRMRAVVATDDRGCCSERCVGSPARGLGHRRAHLLGRELHLPDARVRTPRRREHESRYEMLGSLGVT